MFAMKTKMDTELLSKNKKGLSTVIATVLIILLTLVATSIVWVAVKAFITPQMDKTQCFDVESGNKVTLNGAYTCFNDTSNEVQFSINMKDIAIDALIISIEMDGSSRSFTLTNTPTGIPTMKPYPAGYYGEPVALPGKNAGRTYTAVGFTGTDIGSIKIAPVLGTQQCGASDQIASIDDCMAFA